MEHIAYLDNSATTKPCKKALDYINSALTESWGNPSSLHILGIKAEDALNASRRSVAESINARDDEIIFTGSGTEANNTVVLNTLRAKKRGGKVITTAIEHPSVLETVGRLENEGFTIVKLKPNKNGVISLSELENELDKNTLLVSIMLVNNETGAIQPIKEAASLTRKKAPQAKFHCDAVQGFGKLPIDVKKLDIDFMTARGHKIHGPKGIGFLYCKKGTPLLPLITGGGQEKGLRSGTEPIPLIAGLAGAVADLPKASDALSSAEKLWRYTKEELLRLDDVKINSPENALPYILNISVLGYRSETLLHFLEMKNVFVSSGSACAKGHGSYVLSEMGFEQARTDSALRISFSRENTKEDIDMLVSALKEAKSKLRRSGK